MTRTAFAQYLRETLIPDLRESGKDETARTFEACLFFITQPYSTMYRGWNGEREDLKRAVFIEWLEDIVIPDYIESGSTCTADDFAEAVQHMKRTAHASRA